MKYLISFVKLIHHNKNYKGIDLMYKVPKIIFLVLLISSVNFAQVFMDADSTGNAYSRITTKLFNYEVPDCWHNVTHMSEGWDSSLKKYVFLLNLHWTNGIGGTDSPVNDNDRCINYDRQRVEMKVDAGAPATMQGQYGDTHHYRWKFKVDSTYQTETAFSHVHQIKAGDGTFDTDNPLMTISLIKSSKGIDSLQLRFITPIESGASTIHLKNTLLAPFIGNWVEVYETVTYGDTGSYSVTIKKVSDETVLFTYTTSNIWMWRTGITFCRPKWGLYRSLTDTNDIKSETIKFADVSLLEGSGAVPAAPSLLKTIANANNKITLSWTDNSTNEDQFRIDRSTDGTTWLYLTTVAAGKTQYTDTVTSSTTYYYRIRGENSIGNSSFSNTTTSILEPTVQTSTLTFSTFSTTSITLNFTKGDGAKRIVLARSGSAVTTDPTDNTTYTANAAFGSGTQVGSLNYTVYKDTGSTVTVTGLTANTTYYFKIYELNGSTGTENYLVTSPATGSKTTTATQPTTQATNVIFSSVTGSSMTISCTKGNGAQRIFIVKSGSAVSSDPVDNTGYTASSIFGSGTQLGTGNYVVYKDTGSSVTVTGLSQVTTYYVKVYEYNGSGGNENYYITSPASGSRTTTVAEPTVQASNVVFSAITQSSITVSCTKGNGAQRIIVAHAGSAVSSNPVDNTTYTAISTFGSGTVIGTANYTVYKDTGSIVTVTGLSAATTYYFNVYEFNGSGGSENYLTTSPASSFQITSTAEPTVQATNVTFSSVGSASMTINCTAGNGAKRIFIMHAGSAVSSGPVDNTSYTDSSVFGSGSLIGSGNYVVYKGTGTSVTVTGLSSFTTYYISVYEFNGSGGTENYFTTSPATSLKTTLVAEPTIQASNVSFSSVTTSTMLVSFTKGNGTQRIILVHAGSTVDSDPVDDSSYTASTVFGSGSQIGTGNYTVYRDTGSTVSITGLTPAITYFVNVYELNGSGGNENYLTTSPATASRTTLNAEPTVQSSGVSFSAYSTSSITLNCVKGNGTQRIIVARADSAITTDPIDNYTYSANNVFGSGSAISTGAFVVYKDTGSTITITGLSAGTTYYFNVYEFNGTAGLENYLASNPATGTKKTTATEPTIQASNIVFSYVTSTSMTISCTKGNGAQRVIIVHAGSAVNTDPADNTTYAANTGLGSGSTLGAGNYIVYKDTGSSVTVTGLSAGTTYYYKVYEFNGSTGIENYLTTSPAAGAGTTTANEPTVQASNVSFATITASSFIINCTKGNGAQRIFVVRSGSAVTTDPIDNITYSASSTFGSGSVVGTGNYVVYKDTGSSVTVSGLTSNTTYYVNVYELNGSAGNENYLTAIPATASAATLINGIYSTGTGGVWTATGTWVGGIVPGSSDNVVIASGATVSLGSSVTVLSTTILSSGKISVSANSTLNGNITCYGTIIGSSFTLTTNGNLTVSGTSALLSFSSLSGKIIGTAAKTFTLANGATFENSANGATPLATVLSVSGAGAWTWVVDNSLNNTTISYKNSSSSTLIAALPNSQSYGNIIVKSPTSSAGGDWTNTLGSSLTILGNFTLSNTTTTGGANTARTMTFNLNTYTLTGNGNNSIFSITNTGTAGSGNILLTNSSGAITNIAAAYPGFTTVSFNNTSPNDMAISGGTYTNLTLSGSGSKTTNGNVTVNGTLTLTSGACNLGSGKTLTYGAASTLLYNGSAAQSTGAELVSGLNNLTINNANGVTLNTSVTVNGALTLMSGILSIGANNISLGGSVNGAFGNAAMILYNGSGEVRRLISSTPASFVLPIGTTSVYSPLQLTLNSGTLSSAYIGVKVSATKSSHNTSNANYINRTWTITSSGITNPVYSDTLMYSATDVAGTESSIVGGLYSGTLWTSLGYVDANNHFIMGSGLTTFGEVTAGEQGAFASAGYVTVKVIPQAFYNTADYLNTIDTVTILLANAATPYDFADTSIILLDSLTFTASAKFNNAVTGSYYLVVKHRNSVETWSASTIAFAKGSTIIYDFTDAQNKAYGDNQVQVSASPVRWAIFGGDVNQDGYVDPLDMSLIDQDSFNYVAGTGLATDLNGDHYVDPLDMSIADQNSFNYVGIKKPVSAKTVKIHNRVHK